MPKHFENLTRQDMNSPRYERARRFTQTMLGLMKDFIPHDRECYRRMEDHLMQIGWETNAELISVPPEWDELTKLQIETEMLRTHPAFVPLNGLEN